MNTLSKELRAKLIVERIVADLNKRFGFKLKIINGEYHSSVSHLANFKYLRIVYPSYKYYPNSCSFIFAAVDSGKKSPTYVQLLNNLLQGSFEYHYDNSNAVTITPSSLYGKTLDENEVRLDLEECLSTRVKTAFSF